MIQDFRLSLPNDPLGLIIWFSDAIRGVSLKVLFHCLQKCYVLFQVLWIGSVDFLLKVLFHYLQKFYDDWFTFCFRFCGCILQFFFRIYFYDQESCGFVRYLLTSIFFTEFQNALLDLLDLTDIRHPAWEPLERRAPRLGYGFHEFCGYIYCYSFGFISVDKNLEDMSDTC